MGVKSQTTLIYFFLGTSKKNKKKIKNYDSRVRDPNKSAKEQLLYFKRRLI